MTKALIVEDDQALQFMYRSKLESAGYEVETAENGKVGLEKAERFLPDIILLDLRMPVMTGEEMLQELRSQPWGSNMRVVILTNISRSEAPHMLRFLSVDRYIVKAHTTPSQVMQTVREVVE
jgi:DNA-binding response OmpR family regulator